MGHLCRCLLVGLSLVVGSVVAACDSFFPPPFARCEEPEELPAAGEDLTWHRDVAPIIEGRCQRCHREGGLGGFSLEGYENVFAHRDAVREAVVTRAMPPWMPNHCCGPTYQNDLSLTEQQIADVAAWVDRGAPEGPVVETEPLPPVGGLPRVDLVLGMNEPYTPSPREGTTDDTRCFLVDWPLDEPTFVTGFSVAPGNPAIVHHAIVLIIEADLVPSYQAVDDAEAGPGWSCPGGIVGAFSGWLGGYSPGWEGQMMPAGHGHLVKPGSKLILTMHYSQPRRSEDFGSDLTDVQLVLEDQVDQRMRTLAAYNAFWTMNGMHIPAGEEDVMFASQYDALSVVTPGEPLQLLAANFHMHERGSAGVLGIRRADGSEECLLQVDHYDHEWQENYIFTEPIDLLPGDKLYIECHFDNSAANQRVVNGELEEPRDLNWAEDGEMCVGFITASRRLDDERIF